MQKIVLLSSALAIAFAGAASARTFTFHCALHVDLKVRYDSRSQMATVIAQGSTFELPIARSGSGARYSDGKTTFWEHQGEALFETPGASFTGCKRQGVPGARNMRSNPMPL
jgi:putative lipoprotein